MSDGALSIVLGIALAAATGFRAFLALIAPAAAIALIVLLLWLAIRLLRQVFPKVHSKNRTQ